LADEQQTTSGRELIPVLLYHSVNERPAPEIAGYCVSPAEFERQIAAVAESGREAIDFTELARRLAAGSAPALQNCVCVTFDDGWRDNLEAADTLARHGVPATVFVTSGTLGDPGYLTPEELRELAARPGIEIGAHSRTHPRLDELGDREIADEIGGSRADLAQITGSEPASFAYPHGNHDRRVLAATRAAGYTGAAAVKNALSHATDDPFAVARWTITDRSDTAQVCALLAGRGAPRAWQGERLRTRAHRVLRRARRRLGA
jgi:peptidoglycan/xylan/chitin deacetylase (PgdA/CDA1 family)